MNYLKNWMLTLLLLSGSLLANAQNEEPPYKKNPTIPEFSLLQVDSSSLFSKGDMKQQPTIIMYFSPTCDHCLKQWDDMVQFKDQLKDIQIVMATYEQFDEMKDFYQKKQVAAYPNIKMGRDTKFTLVPFYRMRSLPYQALYDKNGKLITTFEGNVTIQKLVEAFNGK